MALVAQLFIVNKRRRISADQERAGNVSVLPTTFRAALTWSVGPVASSTGRRSKSAPVCPTVLQKASGKR
ncbi:MAG: hypothetical protein ACREX9_23145, partial [Gammaproteobacteria bacterium]